MYSKTSTIISSETFSIIQRTVSVQGGAAENMKMVTWKADPKGH